MRLIVLEPYLRNRGGHQYNYTKNVVNEAIKCFDDVLVLVNSNCDNSVNDIPRLKKVLNDITASYYDLSLRFKDIKRFAASFLIFYRQLKDLLLLNVQLNDRVFIHCAYVFELAILCVFVRFNNRKLQSMNTKILVSFGFDFKRNNIVMTFLFSLFYIVFCNILLLKTNVLVFGSDDEKYLKPAFEKLLNRSIMFFPVPLYPLPVIINKRDNSNFRISYLGGARYNKGFDLAVDTIISASRYFSDIECLVQIDIHKQSKSEIRIVHSKAEQLRAMSIISSRIKIINGPISEENYYLNICNSDIMLLPYRKTGFERVDSNIFRETLLMNRIPLVSRNVMMEKMLNEFGVFNLAINFSDYEEFKNKVSDIKNKYANYLKSIQSIKKYYEKSHNASALMRNIKEM